MALYRCIVIITIIIVIIITPENSYSQYSQYCSLSALSKYQSVIAYLQKSSETVMSKGHTCVGLTAPYSTTSTSTASDCCAFAPESFGKLPKNAISRNYKKYEQ